MPRRPISAEDLLRLEFVGQCELSPDGRRVAYVVTYADQEKDGYRSQIHMLDVASGQTYPFTAGSHRDQAPLWSPDGSQLAFVSNRSGKNQIWVIDTAGGEARQLTKLAAGVSGPAWSPDGRLMAFTARVKAGEELETEGQAKEKKGKDASDVRVINRIKYKFNGIGFFDDTRIQVFVVALPGGEPRQITFGDYDHEHPSWSPDGKSLVFAANRTPEEDYTNVKDIWVAPVIAGEPRQVTKSVGPVGNPIWSADGQTIFHTGHGNEFGGATHPAIWSVPADGGPQTRLTDPELAVGSGVTWDMTTGSSGSDYRVVGDSLLFRAATRGQAHVFRTPCSGGSAEQITQGIRNVVSFSASPGGHTIAYTAASDTDPGQVFVLGDAGERQLTQLHQWMAGELEVVLPEPYTYKSSDGWECQGWIIKPPGYRPGQKYPAVVQIHGGPHAMYGHGLFHEMQYLAAQGYVVVYTNPRGSQGYGQLFTDAVRGDWGGHDYEDIMAGVDAAIEMGFIDDSRLGVAGGSYGGYMTCWVVSHTDRFKAAVTQRALTNRYSFYGTSDIGPRFSESEFPGNPWDDHELLFDRSPIHYVQNITTPLLIIHAEQDLRCPMEQSEQLFIALKRLRRTTEFVRFPDENHELSRSGKPKHRLERLERLSGWFKKHL